MHQLNEWKRESERATKRNVKEADAHNFVKEWNGFILFSQTQTKNDVEFLLAYKYVYLLASCNKRSI